MKKRQSKKSRAKTPAARTRSKRITTKKTPARTAAEPGLSPELTNTTLQRPRPTRLAGSAWGRYLYICAGFVSLALGIIGVVTPILPTTPFILLSGYCFARGSERFHAWIMNHKYFGPMIRAFRDEKRIPLKAKIFATVMIVVTMSATAVVVKKIFPIVAMASVGVAVVTYIWTFKN